MTGSGNFVRRLRRTYRDLNVSRYDLVLSIIPMAFALGLVASGVLSVSTTDAMAIAAAVGVLAVVDALFVHPPSRPGPGQSSGGRRVRATS